MQLTNEQINIIRSVETDAQVIKISAAAGSGKTFTMTELARNIHAKDPYAKILYLVYNQSMKNEATRKFIDQSEYTDILSTYGVAYRIWLQTIGKFEVCNNIDFKIIIEKQTEFSKQYRWLSQRYVHELHDEYCRSWLSLDNFAEKKFEQIQNEGTPQDLIIGYRSYPVMGIQRNTGTIITEDHISIFYNIIKHLIDNKIYTHQMYVKEAAKIKNFRMANAYQYILLDEAQDTNKFILEIFKNFNAKKKYLVGDPYQAIYQFNGCINAFDELEGPEYNLSKSFRFGQNIADLACNIGLDLYIEGTEQPEKIETHKEQTVLFRTNAGILNYAISLVNNCPENLKLKINYMSDNVKQVCNDNINSLKESQYVLIYYLWYVFTEENNYRSLDRLKKLFGLTRDPYEPEVFNKITTYIKHVKIKEKRNLKLNDALKMLSIDDPDLKKAYTLYEQYGDEILRLIEKLIKAENEPYPDVTYTLITAHRAKGLEWDSVIIGPDEKWSLCNEDGSKIAKYYDELNLHYVALTRARYKLDARELFKYHNQVNTDCDKEKYYVNNFLEERIHETV